MIPEGEIVVLPARAGVSPALLVAQHRCQQLDLPFYLIGAGLPNLPAALTEARSYGERLFNYNTIGALSPAQAADALQLPAASLQTTFTPAALELLVTESNGYPYFLREFGKATWEIAAGRTMTEDDAVFGLEAGTAQLDAGFFPARWDRATERERRYMSAMAALATAEPRTADIANHLGAAPSDLTSTRQALIAKGLIFSTERGRVAFTVPGMSAFIQRDASL